MLTHLRTSARNPSRVVVLGAGGFIGGAVARRLALSGIPVLSLGRTQLDLTAADCAERLASMLHASDALVFASARAPVRDLRMFRDNLSMVQVVCGALGISAVAHVVYLSSDAVYRDSPQPLTEFSCAEPASLHGVMHLSREIAIRHEFSGPLAIVRPTLVYGIDDPHNGYGPNRFGRLAASGKDIVLFGEGEERRDHVHVDDVAELIKHIVVHMSVGVVNAVSGEVASFRELAEFAANGFAPRVSIVGSPRVGPMPHHGYRAFNDGAIRQAFPGFRFRPWRDGIGAVHAEMKARLEI